MGRPAIKQPEVGALMGYWTIIGPDLSSRLASRTVCACKCGIQKSVQTSSLWNGDSNSCGCYKREHPARLRHGMSGTVEHETWMGIKDRCSNPNNAYYCGRGIVVCERWKNSFEAFLQDVGLRPGVGYSIDRYPNNNGNYEPGNVRWAKLDQQANNTRANIVLATPEATLTATQWAREKGIKPATLIARFHRGWEAGKIISEPLDHKAGRFVSSRPVTFGGETRSMHEWERHLGLSRGLVVERLQRGWTVGRALNTPSLRFSKKEDFTAPPASAESESGW